MNWPGIVPPLTWSTNSKPAAARQRLDAQEDLAELAGAAALLLVPVVALGRRGDRLAVGDPRRPRVDLEAVGLAQPLEQHAQVQLAEAVDDGLVGAGRRARASGTGLRRPAWSGSPTSAARRRGAWARSPGRAPASERPAARGGCGRPRRRRAAPRRSGSRRPWRPRRCRPAAPARTSTWSLPCSMNSVPDLERLAAVADVEQAVLRDRALVDAEDAEPADEGIDRDLEHVGQHVPRRVGHGRAAARLRRPRRAGSPAGWPRPGSAAA